MSSFMICRRCNLNFRDGSTRCRYCGRRLGRPLGFDLKPKPDCEYGGSDTMPAAFSTVCGGCGELHRPLWNHGRLRLTSKPKT